MGSLSIRIFSHLNPEYSALLLIPLSSSIPLVSGVSILNLSSCFPIFNVSQLNTSPVAAGFLDSFLTSSLIKESSFWPSFFNCVLASYSLIRILSLEYNVWIDTETGRYLFASTYNLRFTGITFTTDHPSKDPRFLIAVWTTYPN